MRITSHATVEYELQWENDDPEFWVLFEHVPTDEELDAACKARGLWKPGEVYPEFTIWLSGTDICYGGGSASGIM